MPRRVERWIIKVTEGPSEPESQGHFRDIKPRKSHHPVKEENGPHAGRVTRPIHSQPDDRSPVSYRHYADPRLTNARPNSDNVAQASCARTEARHRSGAQQQQQQQHTPVSPPARYDTRMSAASAPNLNHYPEHEFPQNPQPQLRHLPQNQQHLPRSNYSSYNMTFGRNGEYQVQIDYRTSPDSATSQYTLSGGSHSGTEHQGNLNVIFGDRPGNVTLNVCWMPTTASTSTSTLKFQRSTSKTTSTIIVITTSKYTSKPTTKPSTPIFTSTTSTTSKHIPRLTSNRTPKHISKPTSKSTSKSSFKSTSKSISKSTSKPVSNFISKSTPKFTFESSSKSTSISTSNPTPKPTSNLISEYIPKHTPKSTPKPPNSTSTSTFISAISAISNPTPKPTSKPTFKSSFKSISKSTSNPTLKSISNSISKSTPKPA